MARIGKIAVSAANFAIDKPYSYQVPQDMPLLPGHRVAVPFGRGNTRTVGIVLALEEGSPEGLKSVERCLDEEPLLTVEQLKLAAFLRERYFCTFCDAVRAMLPAGVWFRERKTVSLTENRVWKEKPPRKKGALEVLKALEQLGGTADEDKLQKQFPDSEALEDLLRYLAGKKWIDAGKDYKKKVTDRTEKIAALAVSPEDALAYAAGCSKAAQMQRQVLEMLCSGGTASVKDLCYYTGASSQTVKRLEGRGLVKLMERPVLRCREIRPAPLSGVLVLSPEQEQVFRGLREQMEKENFGVALLQGVTGSGKTSVYIMLIRSCLEQDQAAMLLVPEIALTPQLLGLLAAHFSDQVAVLHSSLSDGERRDQWLRVKSGQAKVVVGTRSAVFAPCRPKLIILDEEQEHSYLSENAPRYSAREVAIWRGARQGCLVLLGSATPSIESMYRAKKGDYALYRLKSRYNGRPLPGVQIVDMRRELEMGNGTSLSIPLREAILETFQAGKQTILLLNRRGNSRSLLCVDCGKAPECPRCGIRLTYHSANERLMCHYCGFSQPVPKRCPSCGGPLKTLGVGTQKVQEELAMLFPELAAIRMDADTVSAVNTHEKILDRFVREKIPVLIGTQMVAKGLNLPQVTLVGVLDADLSLYTGGYRAGETTFNLLTQVVGRAGRGDTAGRAILQTLNPEHGVITLASRQDYDGFYDLEVNLRRVQSAPPFGSLAAVLFTGQEEGLVLRCAMKFRDSLVSALAQPDWRKERCTVLGPAPCAVPKINYRYRYQLTLRCQMTRPLRWLLAAILRQFGADRETRGVSAFIDGNGFE